MLLTRAQEQRLSRMEAMVADLCVSVKQIQAEMMADLCASVKQIEQKSNQRSDDQSTLDRSTTPSVKAKGSGSDQFERLGDERRFGGDDRRFDGGHFREGGRQTFCAHKVFVKMPSKEKCMKHLKAWKFKFKSTSKRSRLMDSKFSFVDTTVLLNKDSLETIWECVKKEFEETMAACEKNIVDRFTLAEEKESRLQVLDLNQTFMYHQIGHGVDILLAFKMLDHDKEMAVVLQRSTSLTIRDCPDRSSRANRVWKPGGLLCVQDHSGGSILMRTQRFQGLQLQRIIYMVMKFQEVLIDDVLSVMVCLRMVETSSDLLLLNGKENEGCLNGSQALVLMKGITESSSRIEDLMKEEPDFVKVKEVKMEKQKQRKCSKCWMFKFRKENIDQWLGGYNLIATYLDNKKTWMFKYKAPNLDTKVFDIFGQCIRKRLFVSADRGTKNNKPTLRVLMDTKQCRLSLRAIRVWDPGGSLVDAATPCLLSLHFTALYFIAAILPFLKNLEVKVSLKEGDLI